MGLYTHITKTAELFEVRLIFVYPILKVGKGDVS